MLTEIARPKLLPVSIFYIALREYGISLAILKERLPISHPNAALYQQNYDEIKRSVHEQITR